MIAIARSGDQRRQAARVAFGALQAGSITMERELGSDRSAAGSSWHRIERREAVVHRPFEDVVAHIELHTAQPDLVHLRQVLVDAATGDDIDRALTTALDGRALMILSRLDLDLVLVGPRQRMIRLVLGDPRLLRALAQHMPLAAAAAPTTLLVFEGVDGVHLVFDTVASTVPWRFDPEIDSAASAIDDVVTDLVTGIASR